MKKSTDKVNHLSPTALPLFCNLFSNQHAISGDRFLIIDYLFLELLVIFRAQGDPVIPSTKSEVFLLEKM